MILGKYSLSGFNKIFVDLIFILGILLYLTLPFSIKFLKQAYTLNESYSFLLVLLYSTGIFALLITYNLKKLFKSIHLNNPFCLSNVKILKQIGIYSFIIGIMYICKLPFYPTFMTFIVILIFIVLSSFSLILSELFNKAHEYKLENELTI